ncbi:hypothetical protein [Pseudomonas abietaniphila]|uniref:hypothetical protein n=1 Tax=Pseudomonas abietaniphila TaxID=89065 RepID=UPI0007847D04|nr:hypothetical protein [Pseudomonas abietaniphila]
MSSLAEQALEHARMRLAGQPVRPPASKPAKTRVPVPSQNPAVKSLKVVVDGPINHFMFLEGRAWAVDMVKCLRASAASEVINRLAQAAQGRPRSYAAGIQSVIDALEVDS